MKKNRCKPNIFSFLLNGTISCDRIVPLVDKERTYELEEKECGSYIDGSLIAGAAFGVHEFAAGMELIP